MLNCRMGAAVAAALMSAVWANVASAQSASPNWREIETKYIFGFTSGSGVGLEGEKEFAADTEARIGKSGGRYFGSETKLEFEFTPNQYIQIEFGPFVSGHNIANVRDLDDRKQLGFGGFFGELRMMLLERSPSSPLALTLSVEPEWRRLDETNGERVNNVELELKLNGDVELISRRLYAGFNLLYEPEGTHDPDRVGAGWEMESKAGVSGALSYRIAPLTLIGFEAWYLRHYDGAWLNTFTGDAVYIGPTVYWQIDRKIFLAASWNTQVWGHDLEYPEDRLNLSEFSRHRAKLKLAVEF